LKSVLIHGTDILGDHGGEVDRRAVLISDQRRLTTARAEVGTRRLWILNQRDSVPYRIGWRIETG
jgi:hypothetical protein